jgi:hypothetical protein
MSEVTASAQSKCHSRQFRRPARRKEPNKASTPAP